MNEIKGINLNFAVVSAIIEREREGEKEVLIQTRWKPEKDPKYSGTLEIPAGAIARHENIYDALRREIFEETGLQVVSFKPDVRTKIYKINDDEAFAFLPFCCQQQVRGDVARVGFVFLCTVKDQQPFPQEDEVRDIQWIKKSELRKLLNRNPEKFFIFHLGVLDYYLNYDEISDI
jgi:ADP-ribose pyrophosphatase